ncbi:probable E3 SUMO-protein ligase RNF212 isoform X4 [Odocoileus virginianus]|uniref:Probable E3 SUMO-protein ligase RNF212 isoform X4 n=1 Tax=Odocoileus virginianus TaxID=9874 RepID=A0A6J0Y0S6_ODOVR|nr:probable E3 SUMO-protein ligase RNF212 isoform X4 [Odocoileus virginianus texanus]
MDCYCVSLFSYVHAPRLFHGKRDECLICKVACRTILLSKHTDSDIQALFMGIDSLCRKYAKETSQILHPVKKMGNLACHSQDSAQPDKYVNEQLSLPRNLRISRKAQEETVSLLRRKGLSVGGVSQEVDAAGGAAAEGEVTTSSFQHSKNSSFHGLCFLVTAPSARPNGPLFQSRDSSASERVESMEVDLTPSPRRKPEVIAGPPRISLLSPPRDGRMEMLTVLEAGGLKPSSQASAPASYLPELRACRRSLLPDPSTVSLWGSLASSELSWFLATFEQRCLHLRAASPTALSTLA